MRRVRRGGHRAPRHKSTANNNTPALTLDQSTYCASIPYIQETGCPLPGLLSRRKQSRPASTIRDPGSRNEPTRHVLQRLPLRQGRGRSSSSRGRAGLSLGHLRPLHADDPAPARFALRARRAAPLVGARAQGGLRRGVRAAHRAAARGPPAQAQPRGQGQARRARGAGFEGEQGGGQCRTWDWDWDWDWDWGWGWGWGYAGQEGGSQCECEQERQPDESIGAEREEGRAGCQAVGSAAGRAGEAKARAARAAKARLLHCQCHFCPSVQLVHYVPALHPLQLERQGGRRRHWTAAATAALARWIVIGA